MREFVLGFGIGVSEIATREGALAKVTQEWASLADLFRTNLDLQQVFGDVSTSASTREAIARDLLASRVSAFTLELLSVAVEEESPRFLLESLLDLASVLRNEYLRGAPGFVGARRRVDGYALAYFRLDHRISLDAYESQLYSVSSAIGRSRELRRFLSGFGSSEESRLALVQDLFASRVDDSVLRVLGFAAKVTKSRDVVDVLERVAAVVARERGRRVAHLRSARPLSQEAEQRIRMTLSQSVGRDLELRCEVDPSLLGGIVAVVGDKIYDGTVRHRLDVARLALANAAD
ncbi:MAG: ATP synthase F1 subunit delta [Acidimicrobiales bacterium]